MLITPVRNLTSVIFSTFTYLISPPVCSRFSIPTTTSSLVHMHASPCRAPPSMWTLIPSALLLGLLTDHTWLPLHGDMLLILAELWNPYLSPSHMWKPSLLCAWMCPQARNFDEWKKYSFYEIEELCFYQLLILKETRCITNITSQSQNCDSIARSPPTLIFFSFTKDHLFPIC